MPREIARTERYDQVASKFGGARGTSRGLSACFLTRAKKAFPGTPARARGISLRMFPTMRSVWRTSASRSVTG